VCAIAHILEQHGIATVGISLVRGQAVAGRPPRMLHCEFPLGRPLGKPDDPDFQHRVLAAAFELLPRTDVPVLDDFPETIVDDADHPLACALPPFHDPDLPPAVDEAMGLAAAHRRYRDAHHGHTGVGMIGGPERVPDFVQMFVRIADGGDWEAEGLSDLDLGAAALDVRAYYEEAALALADHVPAARQTESWFYQVTEAGKLFRRARAALKIADAPRHAWFRLLPYGQPEDGPSD
jgi:hypothetical protein